MRWPGTVRTRLAVLTGAVVFVGYAVVAFALVWLLTDVVLADMRPAAQAPSASGDAVWGPTGVDRMEGGPAQGVPRQATVAVRVEQVLSEWGRIGVIATAPLAGLITGLIAWLVAGRALRPVGDIERRFRELSSGDLSLRVPEVGGRDEVARLARTMNVTLGRLEESADRQRRFVADAAHELRGPIGVVRADLEVAAAYPDRVDQAEAVREALLDVDRLQSVATDLLTLARLEAGEQALAVEVPLAAVIGDLDAPGGVGFAVRESGGARVRGSRAQLARLVQNLVDNAGRHAASAVELTIGAAGDEVTIAVDDDGPGIPTDQRERVFGRFHRLDDARSRDAGGTGLGLAIVAETARAHGGSARAVDSPLGGARILVTLPAADGIGGSPGTGGTSGA
ncbi:cell wall metabolism sensor histidine kinase WalK [Tsukamurella sp. 1534]|uniref:sensor histidine kinase n=1 Tax=Tsukamurella sp. 1534 TaxID=1151061 RepID=UPI0002EFE3E6|nr:ATP-binding protein [Tsukamurella sp. 1534]